MLVGWPSWTQQGGQSQVLHLFCRPFSSLLLSTALDPLITGATFLYSHASSAALQMVAFPQLCASAIMYFKISTRMLRC